MASRLSFKDGKVVLNQNEEEEKKNKTTGTTAVSEEPTQKSRLSFSNGKINYTAPTVPKRTFTDNYSAGEDLKNIGPFGSGEKESLKPFDWNVPEPVQQTSRSLGTYQRQAPTNEVARNAPQAIETGRRVTEAAQEAEKRRAANEAISILGERARSRRTERDQLLNQYTDAVKFYDEGGFTAQQKKEQDLATRVLLDKIEMAGGLEALIKEQELDASSDRKYAASLTGLNVDDMTLLQRIGGTLGKTISGTEKQWLGNQMAGVNAIFDAIAPAEATEPAAKKEAYQGIREETKQAVWDYVGALVGRRFGGVDQNGELEARQRLDAAIDADDYLYNEYTNRAENTGSFVTATDPRNNPYLNIYGELSQIADRIADGDTSITRDNILSYLSGGRDLQ